ncbi:hypothetical protein GCM10010145_40700 [Streptomyces ruber]|uniref:Uncharacterized protein n=2 Tax=Streptomyces TaxID=1883 RepID=A0A918BG46_9ACTN|nr:hypothetical protein GCM10010145_40700 [Streptomyces ruber]
MPALVCALVVGCGGDPAPSDPARTEVQRVLDRRSEAVLERDETAYRSTEAPAADAGADQRATGMAEFAHLRQLPLASWSYRLTGFRRSGDRATAEAELRYRIRGYDREPVTAARALTLSHDDGTWYVASDEPAHDAAEQLWEQGSVRAVDGRYSLVLGVGHSEAALRAYADAADRAVPAVSDAWGDDWTGRVVVLVPETLEEMAGLLGAPASSYRGIAAVTTGETGGRARAPADRVIVNPDAYDLLGDFGGQVVLTHETTHVATRARTTAATPLWLSEGYADWAAYRSTGRGADRIAPELRREVRAGRVPAGLPDDADFAFGGDAAGLAVAYEGSWLACRMIAERWGDARLNEFYRAVGGHGERAGAVETALRDVLGTTRERFTGEWREYLRRQLG